MTDKKNPTNRFARFAKADAVDAVNAPNDVDVVDHAEAVEPVVATSSFQITPQHAAFFAWVEDPAPEHKAAILEAVAGSGKTSTLKQAARRIPASERGIYVAFNKRVVDEIKGGLPAHISASTMHSVGYRAVLAHFGKRIDSKPDTKKTYKLFDEYTRNDPRLRDFSASVAKLVSKAKDIGLVPDNTVGAVGLVEDTPEVWYELIDRFHVDLPTIVGESLDRVVGATIDLAREVLRLGLTFDANHRSIDFDDQLYLCVAFRLPLTRYKWVLVDEAQDISAVQRAMIHGMIAMRTGRLIACGDKNQSIYGFRSADSESLDAIAREFKATSFPLSVTYRCPTTVVHLAQTYVPHLTPRDGAPAGEIKANVKIDAIDWRPSDLVVCRNNAPLITLAYQLLRKKVACKVLGRDIGAGVKALVRKLRAKDLKDLLARADKHFAEQSAKLRAGGKEDQVEALEDRVETLKAFALEARTLADVERAIDDLFADDKASMVTLATIHKAKGGEAPRVIILDPRRMPSKAARVAWEIQQERNLVYVAYTRAREELIFASLDGAPALPPVAF
jgi:superfamily I DNA/RNA helicase